MEGKLDCGHRAGEKTSYVLHKCLASFCSHCALNSVSCSKCGLKFNEDLFIHMSDIIPCHHYGSTNHGFPPSTIHTHHPNNHGSHYHHSDMNPLATSVNSIFGSSVSTQDDNQITLSGCISKPSDRLSSEQGPFLRSRSLDDLSSLILQEDVHNHHHNHHHNIHHNIHHNNHHHHPTINHNQTNNHHQNSNQHNHFIAPNCPPEGIFNQQMFSSVNCDIENVLQKISRLEM